MIRGEPIQLVWFKRDLRLHDHAPLTEAARRGPVVCLYVYEPDVLAAPTHDPSHLVFENECLRSLDRGLRTRGTRLVRLRGDVPAVFDALRSRYHIETLWSHEETGNAVTYARDRAVRTWCRAHGVRWREIPQHGVFRGQRDRDGWAARWRARMNSPVLPAPDRLVAPRLPRGVGELGPTDLGLAPSSRVDPQCGGEDRGLDLLESFLQARSVDYQTAMSSPVTAFDACSRLSPHLAHGTVSLRHVFQRTVARREELKRERAAGRDLPPGWLRSLASFEKRLRWHCHFLQKFDDEPELEFRNMARAYDGLREEHWDAERFEAWASGHTGYPMVDACMRALHATGWINFRMRAMLVSFASYHLWLHWPRTAEHLARLFVDYEPGIHYPQVQMQSGVTGINTFRIYSPAKQVRDHDPRGEFLRRWLPELEGVPDDDLAEPHRMSRALQEHVGCVIGRDYPAPIVDHATAVKTARSRLWSVRRGEAARRESQEVFERHGSRRRPAARNRSASNVRRDG